MSILSPNEITYKANKDINSYIPIFKEKNDFNLSLDVEIETIYCPTKILGIGADEFHKINTTTPVLVNNVNINKEKIMLESSEISYEIFSKKVIRHLLNIGGAKVVCKIRKKKL